MPIRSYRTGVLIVQVAPLLDQLNILRRGPLAGYPKLTGRIRRAATKTPRKLTGEWQTNRQTRWKIDSEHPDYATEAEARSVELKLLAQLFEFDNAPEIEGDAREIVRSVLGRDLVRGTYRCPVSGRHLDFEKLIDSTDRHPSHGRSSFAVGHMTPLHHPAEEGRHEASNVAWVHEEGNRIQGSLSLDETIHEVFRIANFHRERLGHEWADVERIATAVPAPPETRASQPPEAENVADDEQDDAS